MYCCLDIPRFRNQQTVEKGFEKGHCVGSVEHVSSADGEFHTRLTINQSLREPLHAADPLRQQSTHAVFLIGGNAAGRQTSDYENDGHRSFM